MTYNVSEFEKTDGRGAMMIWVGTAVCYLLFLLYDVNEVRWKSRKLRGAFAVSCAGLAALTLAACWKSTNRDPARLIPGGLFALCFLLLLAYTLFFALPFEATYVQGLEGRRVCRTGVYALCRHPGVLWYAGFAFSLFWALGGAPLLALAVSGTVFDLLYVTFQDVWTFPKTFCDYEEYRREVPFLIPRPSSAVRCLRTLRKG